MAMDEWTLTSPATVAADDLFRGDRIAPGQGPMPCRGAWMAIKRALDVAGAGLGLLVLGPLMLAIALVIRVDSEGGALFRQRRVGRDGKPFRIWKFRTMVVGAEARMAELEALNESQGGVLFKIRRDPRATRVGRLLRRTSLDELPQLINVLRGEMSLVGPRPLPFRDCERLREADGARYAIRQGAVPGLTGPWQVGGRGDLGFDRMLELEVDYILTWSLGRDLALIARTFVVLLSRRGAY